MHTTHFCNIFYLVRSMPNNSNIFRSKNTRSLVFYVLFCRSLFVLVSFYLEFLAEWVYAMNMVIFRQLNTMEYISMLKNTRDYLPFIEFVFFFKWVISSFHYLIKRIKTSSTNAHKTRNNTACGFRYETNIKDGYQ